MKAPPYSDGRPPMSLSMLATRMRQRKSLSKSIGREATDLYGAASIESGNSKSHAPHDDVWYESTSPHSGSSPESGDELPGASWKTLSPAACACRRCLLKKEQENENSVPPVPKTKDDSNEVPSEKDTVHPVPEHPKLQATGEKEGIDKKEQGSPLAAASEARHVQAMHNSLKSNPHNSETTHDDSSSTKLVQDSAGGTIAFEKRRHRRRRRKRNRQRGAPPKTDPSLSTIEEC